MLKNYVEPFKPKTTKQYEKLLERNSVEPPSRDRRNTQKIQKNWTLIIRQIFEENAKNYEKTHKFKLICET